MENMNTSSKLIIFTDLDGTLLDSEYSFEKAVPALDLIKERGIPLIVCSSKTRVEIEHCRKQLNNEESFITENGGGVFVPKKLRIMNYELRMKDEKDYHVLELGASYTDLRKALLELRDEGFNVKGFGDMSINEVSELTGLKPEDAERAKQRDYDEPFVFNGDKNAEARLKKRIKAKGFNYTKGEYFHIMGDSDKGRAVDIVKKLYVKENQEIVTIAIGDSINDIEMLQSVDHPVVVQKKDGSYNPQIIRMVKGCMKAGGVGPEGWTRAVMDLLS